MHKTKKRSKPDAEKKKRRFSGIFSSSSSAAGAAFASKSLSTLREKSEKPLIDAAPTKTEGNAGSKKKENGIETRFDSKEKSEEFGDVSISEPLPLERAIRPAPVASFAVSSPEAGEGGFGWLDKLGVPKSERYRAFAHDRSQAETSQGIVRVAILGQVGAGKTSICKKFCEHGHVVRTEPTVCFELHQKMMKWRSCTFNLNLYDMAGSVDLGNAATGFGRIAAEADCLVLVHDLSDAPEGAQLNYFLNEDVKSIVRNARASGVPVILAMSKFDLVEKLDRRDSEDSVANVAEDYRGAFGAESSVVTSVWENVGIEELFSKVAELSLIRRALHKMCLCKACCRAYVAAREADLGPYLENKRILEAFERVKRRTARTRPPISKSAAAVEGSDKDPSFPSRPSSFEEEEGPEAMDFCDYLARWTGCGCGRRDSESSD
jgi:small GTP-binding protein